MALKTAPDPGENEDPKKTLSQAEQIEQLKNDAADVIDELAPTMYSAVGKTLGTAKSSITIVIAYNPGGQASDSRLDVSGKLTIPGSTVGRLVSIVRQGEDGDAQIEMFED
jgi:hypothetical protein